MRKNVSGYDVCYLLMFYATEGYAVLNALGKKWLWPFEDILALGCE
jgi:hypothetical protein